MTEIKKACMQSIRRLLWKVRWPIRDAKGWVRSFLPMSRFEVIDKAGWHKCIANNRDGYGGAAVVYAARWAHLMEQRMAEGQSLADVAKQASHDADHERISGFMYGAAVSILAHAWAHGEELRRWHNLETQIDHEGEQANESGATLNPALLVMEEP